MTGQCQSIVCQLTYFERSFTFESLVLLSNQVLNRNLSVFKSDVSGTTAPNTLAVHTPSADTTVLSLNK